MRIGEGSRVISIARAEKEDDADEPETAEAEEE